MNRNEQIHAFRPTISSIESKIGITEIEKFQNEILRPILKWQHELFESVIICYFSKQKINVASLKNVDLQNWFSQLLSKDIGLRNILIGTVIALFDVEECALYFKNESEYRKRIVSLLTARLADIVLKKIEEIK